MPTPPPPPPDPTRPRDSDRRAPPDLFQVVVECKSESQQRELFDRLRNEGLKVRLLVL